MSIVNYKIANNVLDGIIGIHGTRRNYDSSTDERRCIKLTPADVAKFNEIFKYNSGIMSDGKDLRLYEETTYFRLPVNISMIDQENDILIDPKVSSLEELAKNSCASLQVYVDGYKLPDSEVKMYPTRSNVDVLIPRQYIKENGSTVIVEKRLYNLYKYIHLYEKKTSQQSFSIDINGFDESRCKERNVQIYIDKKLYTASRTLRIANHRLYVDITTELSNSEVEIIVDPYVMYFFPYQALSYDNAPIYEIPETYIDSIHGPVSRFSCMFFLNGLRVGNTDVDQKGRLHFEYTLLGSVGGNVSFYLSDREKIVDTDTILYGSDYYLYNFIGCDAITKALRTTISGNKYIDAGANKTISGLEAIYKLGTSSIDLSLVSGLIISSNDQIILKIGEKIVDAEDIVVDYESDPITLTVINPAKYLNIGSSAYASVEIKSWFSWDEVLNNNGDLFSRQKVKEVVATYNSGIDASTKVANVLRDRPYLMRSFLSEYGYVRNIQTVEYNGTDAYLYIGIPDSIDVSGGKNYDVSVNNKHIPSNDIIIINKDLTDVFQIEGKYFDTGENEVEIQIFDNNECEYFTFQPSDVENYDGINILKIKGKFNPDRLGDIESNIVILEKTDASDPVIINFPTDKNVGYRLNTRFVPFYEPDEDTLYITFDGGAPETEFLVYNKNFSTQYKYIKPLDSSIADVVIPLYMGTDINPIPYLSRGKILVYSGTERLVEGNDYFIKDESDLDTIGGSFLILKRAILPGSTIDIYFTNIKTNVLFSQTGMFMNNKYGLFYFSSLKFPFSLNYMNMYINGQKLSENDIDILSDKLVRVHSLPTPMYDLSIESAFTVDYSELEPYINEYKEDNFELYLASLFKSVSYDRKFELGESAYDPNEVYSSFIDSVDSVNKIPNPISREAEWIPSYLDENDDSVIGPHSQGGVVLGNNINASLIVGNTFIVGADNGKVASCVLNNKSCDWTPCNFDEIYGYSTESIHSNGDECNNEDITAMVLYNGYILFGTRQGHLYAYDTTNNVWKNGLFTLTNTRDTWPENTAINGFLVDGENNVLYMYGDNGTVDSFTPSMNHWNGTANVLVHTGGVGGSNIMGNIYAAFLTSRNDHQILVVLGEHGEVASCYTEFNTWVKPNGERLVSSGLAPNIYSDGSYRDRKDVYSISKYNDSDYVIFGEDGIVSYYSNSSHSFTNTDNLNICDNTGFIAGGANINASVTFENKYIITGCDNGYVTQYVGEVQNWNSYDSGIGISDRGINMEGNSIRTMQITTNSTNYIIFAGENGKVASYNIDVDEVPYRYDPYKTVFLKWYNTPGNAIIQSVWDIPKKISDMFDMYKEGDENGNICIRGGDNDVMVDIDMNDGDTYPWDIPSRKRFVANFIKSLPEGRYTPDELEELYKNSPAANMLYVEDVESMVFASGDDTDADEDMDLTTIN